MVFLFNLVRFKKLFLFKAMKTFLSMLNKCMAIIIIIIIVIIIISIATKSYILELFNLAA